MTDPAAALAGGVAVLERAISYALGSLTLVTPALLDRPTPCAEWDLGYLLCHLGDSMEALQEAAERGEVAIKPSADGYAVIASVRDRAVRLLGAWAHASGGTPVPVAAVPLSAPVVAGAGAIELTVHGWDVAEACGAPRPIPDELADELLDLAVLLVRSYDRPGRFARPRMIGSEASASARLLAFLGRG
jgi:uncharacterized protein (TIGR03086 family)